MYRDQYMANRLTFTPVLNTGVIFSSLFCWWHQNMCGTTFWPRLDAHLFEQGLRHCYSRRGQFRLQWRTPPISEEFQPKTRWYETTVGMLDKMILFHFYFLKMAQIGVLQRPSFSSEGLMLPKKIDLWKTPLAKGVVMLATMPFFHPCLKFFIGEVLTIV